MWVLPPSTTVPFLPVTLSKPERKSGISLGDDVDAVFEADFSLLVSPFP